MKQADDKLDMPAKLKHIGILAATWLLIPALWTAMANAGGTMSYGIDARRRVFAGVVCANPARQAQPIVAENPAARARPVAVPVRLCLPLSCALALQKPASFVFR